MIAQMRYSMKTMTPLLKTETRMMLVALACPVLFAGCSFAPKYAKPSVQTPAAFKELTPAQFKETDGWKTAEPKDDAIRGQWWEMFTDTNLNALEEQVNISNQTVAAAFANFLSARAVVKQTRSIHRSHACEPRQLTRPMT
jgi:multidrug efflux system outer membrane protein